MSTGAVIFDLDGVISDTAALHAAAWKVAFDSVLERHELAHAPFSLEVDYRRYVDGKSRHAGIESFLQSRSIILPQGAKEDGSLETVNGIANRKNVLFREMLSKNGADFFHVCETRAMFDG